MWFRHGRYCVDSKPLITTWVTLCLLIGVWECSASTSVCRSVNYILDSLPQQCPTSVHPPNPISSAAQIGGNSSSSKKLILCAESTSASPSCPTVPPIAIKSSGHEAHTSTVTSTIPIQKDSATSSILLDIQSHKPETESAKVSTQEREGSGSDDGFLSFEDWKRLNLLQSTTGHDELGEPGHAPKVREAPQPRGRPRDHAIDSIGDEIEIEIEPSTSGKTSKERFNYASFDCAAAVLKSNPEAKGSSSILDENRDRYMLNKCGASNKFVIVEMCEDILVDTVVLANFEFFSSTFKEFRISVTDRYPTNERGWKSLGTFVGNNTRAIQVFAVKNPLIWARYIRIEFISHYGSEFYCPLTLLRIHGTTMMEEYKNHENSKHDEALQDSSDPVSDSGVTLDVAAETVDDPTDGNNFTLIAKSSQSIDKLSSQDQEIATHHTHCNLNTPLDVLASMPHTANLSKNSESERTTNTKQPDLSATAEFHDKVHDITTSATQAPNISDCTTVELSQEAISNISVTSMAKSETASVSISPTTQESVYKTITKRLSLLEANASLSLRYIEEQSHLLRDVFNKMERRQSTKIDSVLSDLNATWVTQIHYFREQYQQLWQSTIVELEGQKQASREEIIAISSRLSLLTDELIFQKRMSIAHSIMLLVTLLFILTTRGVTLEIPSVGRIGYPSETPATSPIIDRNTSAVLLQREGLRMHRRLSASPEYRKLNRSWHGVNASAEFTQSAPTTPAAASRSWQSSRSSALNHYQTLSDTDNSDSEYAELTRDFDGGSSLQYRRIANGNSAEKSDYPTPSSNSEVNE